MPFDFPGLPREKVEPHYRIWSYPDRQPGPAKISLAVHKDWICDLFYMLHLETDEEQYRAGAAEAFYMAKTSMKILFR